MNVKDKSIMITGAGGGLGSVMASLLAKNGAQVMILDMDSEKGQAAADAICKNGNKAWFFRMDVTSEEDWKSAVDYTIEKTGKRRGRCECCIVSG